jgi:hypothetical protein
MYLTLEHLGDRAFFGAPSDFSGERHSDLLGAEAAVGLNSRAPSPVFRFQCTTGCSPFPGFVCRELLLSAVLRAYQLALNAARKLEAKPRALLIVNAFRQVFDHDPSLPLPWPGIRDSGMRFALRFRAVAQAWQGAGTFYRCDPCTQIREDPPVGSILDAHAVAIPPNEVVLCPSFWGLPDFLRAGVLLHEMFHLRFDPCFGHGPCETKRTSAYCYEAFALSIAGHTPEQLVIDRCGALKK